MLKHLTDAKVPPPRSLVFADSNLLTREEQILNNFRARLDRLTTEIKSRLTIKFSPKQRDIRLTFQPSDFLRIRCDETVSLAGLGSYLTNSFYDLLIKAESGALDEAYFLIRKVQALVAFCKANGDKNSFENETIFARVNELVFMQNHDLVDAFASRFGDFMRVLKHGAGRSRKLIPGPSTPPEEIEQIFRSKLLSLRIKTKALFAMALMHSDQKQHDLAIANALRALRCAYSTLQTTLCVLLQKLVKKDAKIRAANDESVKQKMQNKRASLLNSANIVSSILSRVDATPNLLKKSSKLGAALAHFRTQFLGTDDPCTPISAEEIDLAFLNNPDTINTSLLKDSTILHLTNLNYISFGHEADGSLEEEISERGLLEKFANLAVAFYILSVEHRFNEHNALAGGKFYKILLDYYNPDFHPKGSELFLSKAVEIAFLYLPDTFPFVSQILLVFKNFELNRSKQIPENGEDSETVVYLHPYKNGFKSGLVIPVIRTPCVHLPLARFESTKERENRAFEAEFVSEKIIVTADRDPQTMIRKIYVPRQKNQPKSEKMKIATAVVQSPDLLAQKHISAIKTKVFRGGLLATTSTTNHIPICENESVVEALQATAPVLTPGAKVVPLKPKKPTESGPKPRVGSSKISSNKENDPTGKTEKRANSSEITRTVPKDPKLSKTSTAVRIPAKVGPKTEFSLLKSTEFLFNENCKKVALKMRPNNENIDINKKCSVLGQIKPNGVDRRPKREPLPTPEIFVKDVPPAFFLGASRASPQKPADFKISGSRGPPAVYFQNFIKNKNNIAEILSKFK